MKMLLLAAVLGLGQFVKAETATPWTDRISLSGDLRIRHDWISKSKPTDSQAHKERYRARVGLKGQVSESLTAKVRLASADGGGDPISTNATFTDNASKKAVYIDLASLEWKMCEDGTMVLGKQEIPLKPVKRSQVLYDDDYTPEGVYVGGAKNGIFTKLGAFSIQERSPQADGTSEPDSWLMAGLVGFHKDLSDSMNIMIGAGYHDFTALKKNAALGGGSFYGNSNTGTRYVHDYKVGQVLAEAKWKMSGSTLGVFADYIFNFAAEEDNTGLAAGAEYQILDNSAKALWIFSYTYQMNGKDSTVSAINNSDFNRGIDGGFGHILTAGRAVASNALLNVTYYRGNVDNSGNPFWIDRLQTDIAVHF
jgi:hypothetical protein